MNNFQVNDLTKGSDGVGKLDFLNSQIKNADGFSPVVIGGKNYDSAKQYWQLTHDSYLAGNGAGLFSNFFNEMESNFANKIKASVNQYGYVPDAIMKSYQDIFTNLKTRTDVAPYVDNITNLQSNVLGSAMGYTANSILDAADTTGDYVNASNQLTSFSTKYGVDVTTAKEKLAGSIISKTNSNGADPVPFLTKAGITPDTIKTPEVTPTTPDTTTPTTTPTTPLVSPNLPNSGSNVSSTPTATIQTALGIKNDGIYGVQTTQKVKEFQTANGLVADGIVGSKTLSKLQELNLIPPATTVTPAIPTPLVVTPPVVQPKTVAPAPVIPVTTPAPVKTPVATPTPTPKTYKVVAGDTISKIAAKLGTTANKITGYKSGDPNKINVGETLTY
jgi:peptidoglycan hydrolase-like protein with peptidoglycan-binding domain